MGIRLATHGLVFGNHLTSALGFCRNYGGSLAAQEEAQDFGCQQVLWLYGEDHQITEAGTMNIFLYWINEDGGQTCYQALVFIGIKLLLDRFVTVWKQTEV